MNAENRLMFAMLFTFLACVCVCMVTIFLVATMTIRSHAPAEPLYRIAPISYPAPAPWQPLPEQIGPPSPKD